MTSCEDKLSADFTRVPVIDVHKDNLSVHLPGLLRAIEESSFVAIDCVRLYIETRYIKKNILSRFNRIFVHSFHLRKIITHIYYLMFRLN